MTDVATNLAIVENGVVTNRVWGYPYTPISGAVQIDDLAVQIGDTYDGEYFYHNGVQVKSVEETHSDEVAGLMDEIESLCNEIIMGV